VLEDAVSIACQAGQLTLRQWRKDLTVDLKADGTEVTDADRAAEQLVRTLLIERYPNDGILGEEFGTIGGDSGRTWIVDPIDGTYGFVRGVPLFSTLLALIDADGSQVGVMNFPALDLTVCAARGKGCFANGSTVEVSTTNALKGSLLCATDWAEASAEQLMAVHGAGLNMRTWGDAYGYAMVATGKADAMVDPICSEWDLAPMPVIIDEAGGKFTDLEGRRRHDGGHGLASNGLLHDELLGLVGVMNASHETS